MDIFENNKRYIIYLGIFFVVILSFYFMIKTLSEFRAYKMVGNQENTISVSGYGEISAVPDIATIYFTIQKEAKVAKEAQDGVGIVEKSVLSFLKDSGIEDKDIKTSNSSFNPKYEYVYNKGESMPCINYNCPPSGKNVIVGYEAFETLTVKIRNTDDLGKITQGLAGLGVSNLNGPNFGIDDEDELKIEARRQAIIDAKKKAKILAKDLDVRLGGMISFYESGDYPNPSPMYMKAEMAGSSMSDSQAIIPKGENVISSNVTLVYKIR